MRTKKGIVSSAKMTGTVSVIVHRHVFHPIYKKRFRRSKKFLADNNGHDLYEGDMVLITECNPISKNKCFQVTEILQKAPRVDDIADEKDVQDAIAHERVKPVVKKSESKDQKSEEADTPNEANEAKAAESDSPEEK